MNYYKTLNINKTDDSSIIKNAYHYLVKKYHPDRNNNNNNNKIYEINEAYNHLIIPKMLQLYSISKIINCSYYPEQLLSNEIHLPLKLKYKNKNYIYLYNLERPVNKIKLLDYQIKINCYQDNSNHFYHINNNIINIINVKLLPFINGFNYDLILNHITLKIFLETPYINQIIHINNKNLNSNVNFYIIIKLLPPDKKDIIHFKKIDNIKLDNYIIYN